MPVVGKSTMRRPRTTLPAAFGVMTIPWAVHDDDPHPWSMTIGIRVLVSKPGWVVALIVSGAVIGGRLDASAIVFTPFPTMLNVITSAPAVALASMIAWRSDPAPVSLVVVTAKVAAAA